MNRVQLEEQLDALMYENLWRFILPRVRDPHVADDVLQETLVSAMEKIDQLQDDEKLKSWLTTIATNKCHEALRKKSRHTKRYTSVAAESLLTYMSPEDAESTESTVINRMELAVKTAYVDRLPGNIRQIVVLHAVDGLTFTEIADILHMNVNRIKSQYYRARMRYIEWEEENRHED